MNETHGASRGRAASPPMVLCGCFPLRRRASTANARQDPPPPSTTGLDTAGASAAAPAAAWPPQFEVLDAGCLSWRTSCGTGWGTGGLGSACCVGLTGRRHTGPHRVAPYSPAAAPHSNRAAVQFHPPPACPRVPAGPVAVHTGQHHQQRQPGKSPRERRSGCPVPPHPSVRRPSIRRVRRCGA